MSRLPKRQAPLDLKKITDIEFLKEWIKNPQEELPLLDASFYCNKCHYFKDTTHRCPVWEKDNSPFKCLSFENCPTGNYKKHSDVPKPWTVKAVEARINALIISSKNALKEQKKKKHTKTQVPRDIRSRICSKNKG
jgi:hypothetical protein